MPLSYRFKFLGAISHLNQNLGIAKGQSADLFNSHSKSTSLSLNIERDWIFNGGHLSLWLVSGLIASDAHD